MYKLRTSLTINKIKLIILLTILCFTSSAQEIEDIRISGEFIKQPITIFFNYLEEQHKLKIFYKKSWIDNMIIDQRFDSLLIEPALARVFRNSNLGFDFFQNNKIIIYQTTVSDHYLGINSKELLHVIGNPLNIGRYRKATISGKIVNGKNGDPLTGAVIYNSKLSKGTSTDKNGNFNIELPTGEHFLQLSFMGFEQSTRKIRLIESGQIEIELFEESHNIGEVTVTGKGANISRTQMSMLRVDSKLLKELPVLMGETDVIKGLTMMAGVQTVSELSSGFNVRGGNTDQNLVLVNGSPVFNTSHLFGFFSMLNPDVVDDIRLYKGGMPAKFGERVSSVMEIDIKEGNNESIKLYGGIGIINSRLTIDGPLSKNKKLKLLIGGRTSYSDWILKKIPSIEFSQSATKFYDLSGKITYNFNLHNKMSLMAYSSNNEFSTSLQSAIKYGNQLANLFLRTRFNEKINGELSLSYSSYKFRLTDFANNKPFESYYLDNQLQYNSAKYHFNWHPHERHIVSFGLNSVYYISNPGKITPIENETIISTRTLQQEKALEIAAYISDEFEIVPEVSVNVGIRYSQFNNYGPKTIFLYDENTPKSTESIIGSLEVEKNKVAKSYGGIEPRLSINYDLQNGYSFKLNYQRTQQFFNQISNNAVISPAESWKASDYHLKPLINDQIAVGVSNNNLLSGFQLSAEMYYKKLQNLIEYKNGAEIIMNQHIETDLLPSDGYAYGFEFSAKKTNGRLTGMINYMLSRTMRKTDGTFDNESINNGSWYPSIYDKPHDLSVSTTYNISRRWRFSANFVYISGRPVTLPEVKYKYANQILIYYSDRNKYRMQPYHRVDIALTIDENLKRKRSWKGSWTLSVYNLYDRHNPYSVYYKNSTPAPGSKFTSYSLYKLSVIGIPVPTLSYNFRF